MKLIDMSVKQLKEHIGKDIYYIRGKKVKEHCFVDSDFDDIDKQMIKYIEVDYDEAETSEIKAKKECAEICIKDFRDEIKGSTVCIANCKKEIARLEKELAELD